MSKARKLTNHEEIKRWAEERGAHPAVVEGTEGGDGGVGVLRLDFDGKEENLRSIDWETFFDTFESKKLALLAQEEIDGETSRFAKFVER